MATLEQKRRPLARSGWQNELWLIPVQVGILVALLVLWQVSVSQKNLMFFSRPTLVAERLYELFVGGEIYRHILVTMQEVLIGYALGAFLGLTLGYILGRSNILVEGIPAVYHRPLQHPQDRARTAVHRLVWPRHRVEGRRRPACDIFSRVLQYLFQGY